jgi:hypothetical protein
VSARDARTGPTRDRSAGRGSRRVGTSAPGRQRPGARPAARRTGGGGPVPAAPVDDEGLVVGPVPPAARFIGGLLLVAGLVGLVAVFPPYLTVGGQELSHATGVGAVLAGWLVPLVHAAVGAVLLRGAVPKFGLAYAGVAGALAVGTLLIEVYRGSTSTARPGIEVIAGERVLTSSVSVGAGWVLGLVSVALVVIAGAAAVATWGRTVMDDRGTLDPRRPVLAGAAALLGVATVLTLAIPAADVPDQLVVDPATGLETVVTQEGPQALLERPGLALLGGLLLAGAIVLCSVIAPSLRPRLAAVGGLLAIAAAVLAAGLGGLVDAAGSDQLEWTVPGAGLLLTGLGYGVLTVVAWRAGRSRG